MASGTHKLYTMRANKQSVDFNVFRGWCYRSKNTSKADWDNEQRNHRLFIECMGSVFDALKFLHNHLPTPAVDDRALCIIGIAFNLLSYLMIAALTPAYSNSCTLSLNPRWQKYSLNAGALEIRMIAIGKKCWRRLALENPTPQIG